MSLSLDAAATARIATTVRGAQWLIELDFVPGTLYLTTNAVDIPADASVGRLNTYTSRDVQVANLTDSENTSDEKVTLSAGLVNTSLLVATLEPSDYRFQPVRLYLQMTDDTFQPVGAPRLRWQGYMDPVRIERKTDPDGPSIGRITLPCRRAGTARARNADGLRLSDAQQQAEFSGDRGYEYVTTLIEQPSLWLSKKFQEV